MFICICIHLLQYQINAVAQNGLPHERLASLNRKPVREGGVCGEGGWRLICVCKYICVISYVYI